MGLTTKQLVEVADAVATDLLHFGELHNLSAKDILMASMIAQRLVQSVTGGDDLNCQQCLQEANATFRAVATTLEQN